MSIYEEPNPLFICTGFVPPQEPVEWIQRYHGVQEKHLAFIYAAHPVISTIRQVSLHLFMELGTAALFGTYHSRFGVITFPHYSKEPPLSLQK